MQVRRCKAGFDRASENLAAAPCQSRDAERAWPLLVYNVVHHVLVHHMDVVNLSLSLIKCRGLAPAVLQPAGADGSVPGGSEKEEGR